MFLCDYIYPWPVQSKLQTHWGRFSLKTGSYKDKTVWCPSHFYDANLYNGIPYSGKTAPLYWICPLAIPSFCTVVLCLLLQWAGALLKATPATCRVTTGSVRSSHRCPIVGPGMWATRNSTSLDIVWDPTRPYQSVGGSFPIGRVTVVATGGTIMPVPDL